MISCSQFLITVEHSAYLNCMSRAVKRQRAAGISDAIIMQVGCCRGDRAGRPYRTVLTFSFPAVVRPVGLAGR